MQGSCFANELMRRTGQLVCQAFDAQDCVTSTHCLRLHAIEHLNEVNLVGQGRLANCRIHNRAIRLHALATGWLHAGGFDGNAANAMVVCHACNCMALVARSMLAPPTAMLNDGRSRSFGIP